MNYLGLLALGVVVVALGSAGTTQAQTCYPTFVRCANVEKCIHESQICNGVNDCGDWSEEMNCPCDGHKCNDGHTCLPSNWICDGDDDCHDWSDETNCPNCPGHVCPGSNVCVPERLVCNGKNECGDWSDEANCTLPAHLVVRGNTLLRDAKM